MCGRSSYNEICLVAPYIIQLIGEYVVEILQIVRHHLKELDREIYSDFLAANGEYYEKTRQRVRSYWNCYYRWQYSKWDDYVGCEILHYFDNLRR